MNGETNPGQRQFPDLDEFEALRIDPERFNHAAHVYVGWLMLSKYEPVEATLRFTGTLRRLVKKLGAEDKYHETISWFYMLLIAERRQQSDAGDWASFASETPTSLAIPANCCNGTTQANVYGRGSPASSSCCPISRHDSDF